MISMVARLNGRARIGGTSQPQRISGPVSLRRRHQASPETFLQPIADEMEKKTSRHKIVLRRFA